jgi:hypothetical protein
LFVEILDKTDFTLDFTQAAAFIGFLAAQINEVALSNPETVRLPEIFCTLALDVMFN